MIKCIAGFTRLEKVNSCFKFVLFINNYRHPGVWALRNSLLFLVNNLQYYLQVVVIEAQFAVLKKSIENAKNVEDIIKLHAQFLGNLISRTFLMSMEEVSVKHILIL